MVINKNGLLNTYLVLHKFFPVVLPGAAQPLQPTNGSPRGVAGPTWLPKVVWTETQLPQPGSQHNRRLWGYPPPSPTVDWLVSRAIPKWVHESSQFLCKTKCQSNYQLQYYSCFTISVGYYPRLLTAICSHQRQENFLGAPLRKHQGQWT